MKRRGFTLLELMVATVIMGVAVVGLLSGLSGSLRNASKVRDADRTAMLARAKMNDLLADRTLRRNAVVEGPFDPSITGGVEGGWRARITPFEAPLQLMAGVQVIDRIELEIWWMAGSDRRSFTLDGYRPYILTQADVPGGGR